MAIVLSTLYIYPVKSCAPLMLSGAQVEPRGLAYDRRWMVVDADGKFMTGRKHPRMTLIQSVAADCDGVRIAAPGMPGIALTTAVCATPRIDVRVWGDTVSVRAAAADANAWITRFLGMPARFVYMDETSTRAVDPNHARVGDVVSFADGYPLLLIAQASLDGLNARLGEPVPMARFRPNLVVDGTTAHAEDGWRRIRIGAVEFEGIKACTRCVFTTVDPTQGAFDPTGEPLRTLAGYRRREEGITFGQNFIARGTGTIVSGDTLEVLD
ncbi:MAG: MOSC N-terminal beta barrel domain-containing protein [Dokdonella sp.]